MARSTPFAALRAQMRPETRARAVALTDALRQEMNRQKFAEPWNA
jgi:hypothetical protein